MPPNLGVSDAAIVEAVRDRRARRGACSTAPSARVLRAGRPGRRRAARPAAVDVDAHHALARARRARVRGAAEERRRRCCRCARPGGARRGGRRVRPHAALPGRRQLAGQPDPGRRRARRAARRALPGRRRRSTSPPGFGIDDRPDRRRGAGRRGGRRRPAAPTSWSPSSACRPRDESEGFDRTAHRPARRPARRCSTGCRRGQPAASSSCSPTAPRCARRTLGARTPPAIARVLAGRAGRRRRGRRPAARRGQPVRPARRDHPAAAGGQPVVPELPRRGRATCATARASSSATAATTRSAARSRYPFGHGLSYTTLRLRRPDRRHGRGSTTPATSPSRSRLPGHQHRRPAPASEVVQLYVGDPAAVGRPAAAGAQGLRQVDLAPGRATDVELHAGRARPRPTGRPPTRRLGARGRRVRPRRRRVVPRPPAQRRPCTSTPPRRRPRWTGCPRCRSGWPTPTAPRPSAPPSAPTRTAGRRHPGRRRADQA